MPAESASETPEPVVAEQPVAVAEAAPQHEDGKSNGGSPAVPTPEAVEAAIMVEPEHPAGDVVLQETARTTVIDVSQMKSEEKPARKGWWRRGD